VSTQHVDHVAGRFAGDEQRYLGALADRQQLLRGRLAVGDDEHRRLERDDARDAPRLVVGRAIDEVVNLAPPDDLHPVGMDVVQVADQIGRRLRVAHGKLVEAAFRVGVSGQPFPTQRSAVRLEQRFGADDGRFHRCARGNRSQRMQVLKRPTSAAPNSRSARAA
jgi:hypothetical protein